MGVPIVGVVFDVKLMILSDFIEYPGSGQELLQHWAWTNVR